MRVAFAILGQRIAPVFDTARELLLVDRDDSTNPDSRLRTPIPNLLPARKIVSLAEHHADVLVCGAISRHLETMLVAYGIEVKAFVAGDLERVIEAFFAGELDADSFAMPGCRRRCRNRWRGKAGLLNQTMLPYPGSTDATV